MSASLADTLRRLGDIDPERSDAEPTPASVRNSISVRQDKSANLGQALLDRA